MLWAGSTAQTQFPYGAATSTTISKMVEQAATRVNAGFKKVPPQPESGISKLGP